MLLCSLIATVAAPNPVCLTIASLTIHGGSILVMTEQVGLGKLVIDPGSTEVSLTAVVGSR